jgi:2-polyprenyl-3-methyl-5-hydroxy-6-metoxy-1,4-benzoquinol methylase
MGDVLHYLPPEIREKVIRDCIETLNPGGVIVIREGIRELKSRHKGTRLSEFFSTRITHFNQTRNERKQLWFISAEEIRAMAGAFGCAFEILDQGKRTSNVLMVIRKPGDRNC